MDRGSWGGCIVTRVVARVYPGNYGLLLTPAGTLRRDAEADTTLAPLEGADFGMGEGCDLSLSGSYSHTVTKGEPIYIGKPAMALMAFWLSKALYCQNSERHHRTHSMRTADESSVQIPGGSVGSHRRICGGAMGGVFGHVYQSSWSETTESRGR